jgi:hypothetical protein
MLPNSCIFSSKEKPMSERDWDSTAAEEQGNVPGGSGGDNNGGNSD